MRASTVLGRLLSYFVVSLASRVQSWPSPTRRALEARACSPLQQCKSLQNHTGLEDFHIGRACVLVEGWYKRRLSFCSDSDKGTRARRGLRDGYRRVAKRIQTSPSINIYIPIMSGKSRRSPKADPKTKLLEAWPPGGVRPFMSEIKGPNYSLRPPSSESSRKFS
jgi:hypothetical protein